MDDRIIHVTALTANIYHGLIPKCLALFEDGFAATVPTFSKVAILAELEIGTQEWYVLVRGDDEPISIAVYQPADASVWSLCTATTYRRMGYARRLLIHILVAAAAAPETELFIKADTPALGEFYKSLGYTLLI
jgi:ribosomal protein S18 acetylase RimI-like enzyme